MLYKMSHYSPKPYEHSGGNVEVELDLIMQQKQI